MANIKVSEMTEATVFDDGDYAMIVQANQNKKISKENMLSDIETKIGDLTNLQTTDKTSVVNAINEVNFKEYGKVGLSGQSSIVANNYKKVPYDYTFSLSSGLTLTNDGGIKVSQGGYYLVIARVRLTSFSSSGTGYIAVRKNDENTNLTVSGITKPNVPFEINTIASLNTNDTIYAYAFCDENANIFGGGNPPIWVTLEVISL